MKRLLVILAACGNSGSHEPPAPTAEAVAPKAVEPMISAVFAGCAPALPRPVDPRASAVTLDRSPFGRRGGLARPTPIVRVEIARLQVAGDLDETSVRRYLRRESSKLRVCYERAVASKPRLAGTVVARFAIPATGAVASAHADGVDPGVSSCIVGVLNTVRFPRPRDGNLVQVTATLALSQLGATIDPFSTPRVAPPAPPASRYTRPLREWTPFAAAETVAPPDIARPVANEVAAAMRERLAAVEHCFDGARGAIRAMIAIDTRGAITSVRSGGIGDSALESCVASAVAGFTVTPPSAEVEVACDFTRGGDAPLRVSPDAGYNVVELTAREMRNRTVVRDIPARDAMPSATMLGRSASVLVVAEPDAPGHGLDAALWWAPEGTTLVAVKASGGAPVLLGMGDSRARRGPVTELRLIQLRTDGGRLRACLTGSELPETAAILDPRAMDRVFAAVTAACQQTPCEPTVIVGTSGDFILKDLVATTSAARRAGFSALSIGGLACEP